MVLLISTIAMSKALRSSPRPLDYHAIPPSGQFVMAVSHAFTQQYYFFIFGLGNGRVCARNMVFRSF